MAEPSKPVDIRVEYEYPERYRIGYCNQTRFTHIGNEIILDMATLNDQMMIDAFAGTAEPKVKAQVTHRFAMSIETFLRHKNNVDEILKKLLASGVIEEAKQVIAAEERK